MVAKDVTISLTFPSGRFSQSCLFSQILISKIENKIEQQLVVGLLK